jgi:manganese transport protein
VSAPAEALARPNGVPLPASLPEVHRSVAITGRTVLRKLMSFSGPGYLVAVGYMDPGNWATSLAGGSAFGYTLLSVVLLSNIMAVLLQALAVRMGIAGGRDLAQMCSERFSKPVGVALWVMAEAAIIATDLAEVIGTAIAIHLLFGLPLPIGVVLTALDVFIILWLQGKGFRRLEAFVVALTLVIAVCFAFEIAYSSPEWGAVLQGYVPQTQILRDSAMLYLALGILGATVMPHNLYLHSSIVQTRDVGATDSAKREAIRFATFDSTVALTFALFVNSAILILAAATFHTNGMTSVAEIEDAHRLLAPTLGAGLASTLFAVALLASGLNSTVTATLAGQIVMEGFIRFRMAAWARRLVTRGIAILPAVGVSLLYGSSGTAKLLVLSQVVLSLQLPFAVVPLVLFTANRARMRGLPAPRWQTWACAVIAAVIIALNVKLIVDFVSGAA